MNYVGPGPNQRKQSPSISEPGAGPYRLAGRLRLGTAHPSNRGEWYTHANEVSENTSMLLVIISHTGEDSPTVPEPGIVVTTVRNGPRASRSQIARAEFGAELPSAAANGPRLRGTIATPSWVDGRQSSSIQKRSSVTPGCRATWRTPVRVASDPIGSRGKPTTRRDCGRRTRCVPGFTLVTRPGFSAASSVEVDYRSSTVEVNVVRTEFRAKRQFANLVFRPAETKLYGDGRKGEGTRTPTADAVGGSTSLR